MSAVGAPVVRQHRLDGDSPLVEPLDGPNQDGEGRLGGFVVVDLGVGTRECSSMTV
ncbi:hypothetical protein JDV76_08640 [Corynebacterium sp. CCM 8864]|uniref:Uncharacterized protein n=1 Tax=Corynebacterium marambiense TaxID=2765364 RepID=A0ABS0W0D0_9CORY|nr:hypothetical protein [Corynebacterium marambiense]